MYLLWGVWIILTNQHSDSQKTKDVIFQILAAENLNKYSQLCFFIIKLNCPLIYRYNTCICKKLNKDLLMNMSAQTTAAAKWDTLIKP